MDTGFPFLTRTFRVYHREDKIIANASGTPFLLIPETFSVMALAFDSSIFFLLSDILPRLRHHSSRDPRMCCRTIPRFPAAELITPIKPTKPFPVRYRSTTNDEYRAPRRDKSATQKNSARCFFKRSGGRRKAGVIKKTKGSRPGRAPKRLTTTREEERSMRWTWWNEERFLAWPMDRCNEASSTSQQANNFTAPTNEFSCGWAAVDDGQGVTGFRYWVLGIGPFSLQR